VSEQEYEALEKVLKEKVDKTYTLVTASLEELLPFELNRTYTPKELEPYDALADRFIRCVEVFIKYFKAYEYHNFADKSPTLRDGMNVMEKVGLITKTPLWMDMRDVRNRIVHNYLPEQTKDIFDSIMGEFFDELTFVKKQIEAL
jgi:hypothetical protein